MANGMRYIGKLSLERLTASVDLSRDRADVTSDYSVRNRARRDLKVNLGVARPGLAGAVIKTTPTVRPTFTRVATPRLESFTRKTLATTLKPQQKHVLHVAYSAPVFGTRSRSFLYVPSLQVNNLELLQPVANYEVSLKLRYIVEPKTSNVLVADHITAQMAERLRWTVEQRDRVDGLRIVTLRLTARGPVVLIIDDNEGLVNLLGRYLTEQACRVVAAADGQEGLRLTQELLPDAIVLDVMMPGMHGWEVLQRIRNHPQTAEIPVIICSVVNNPELAQALGASTFLPKPVRQEDVLAALGRVGVV